VPAPSRGARQGLARRVARGARALRGAARALAGGLRGGDVRTALRRGVGRAGRVRGGTAPLPRRGGTRAGGSWSSVRARRRPRQRGRPRGVAGGGRDRPLV